MRERVELLEGREAEFELLRCVEEGRVLLEFEEVREVVDRREADRLDDEDRRLDGLVRVNRRRVELPRDTEERERVDREPLEGDRRAVLLFDDRETPRRRRNESNPSSSNPR